MKTLKQLLEELMAEHNLHPEIMAAVKDIKNLGSKSQNIDSIVEYLHKKGIDPGFRTDIPRPEGSSRGALLLHENDTEKVNIDGQEVNMPSVIKYVKAAKLDAPHMIRLKNTESLGTMQNRFENGELDYATGRESNDKYRVLSHDGKGNYTTNEFGLFPPLLDHDKKNHQWSQVGFAPRMTRQTFMELTKTPEFPNGISHSSLMDTISRAWHRDRGSYYKGNSNEESLLDDTERHPLVQSLIRHQIETGTPPHDYSQLENWGMWEHPVTKKKHPVIVDHGFSEDVQRAYKEARRADHRGDEYTDTYTGGGRRKNFLAKQQTTY